MQKWVRRALLGFPLVIAGMLNLLVVFARPLHLRTEHIASYGFLFATPWAWLLDHDWIFGSRNRALEALVAYLVLLWVPAILYSGCIWVLIRIFQWRRTR